MPSTREADVLVLGAYGQVGRRLALELAALGFRVLAAGRRRERLDTLVEGAGTAAGRLEPAVVDAKDPAAVAAAARRSGLIVNCIGPFVKLGPPVAAAAVAAGAHYVDIASEQAHYRAVRELSGQARAQGTILIPGAGLYPGLSGLLLGHLMTELPTARGASLAMATGTPEDRESGVASLLTGLLEMGYPLQHLREGALETIQPTSGVILEVPRYGAVPAVRWPTLEVLSLAGRHDLQDFDTYAALGGAPVPRRWEVALVRLLAPHRRGWAYRLAERFARAENARLFDRGRAKGWETATVLRASVSDDQQTFTRTLIAEDMVTGTCLLPLRLARVILSGSLQASGLASPVDLLDAGAVLGELTGDPAAGIVIDQAA